MATTIEAGWANPTDRLASYPVDMKCGHVEMRKMRPSTARAVITPDGLIHSAELCRECSATRDAIAIPALVKRMGWDEVGVTGEIAEEEANPCECGSLPHVAGCYLFEPMSCCLGCATPIAGPVLFCAACLEVGHQATLEMIDAEAKRMPSFRQQTTDPRLIARAARING